MVEVDVAYALPWGLAIVLSAVKTGWHYAVDVLAGALVAELALWASRALLPRLLGAEKDPFRS